MLWGLVTNSAAFPAIAIEIDAAIRRLLNGIGEELIISRAIYCNDLSASTSNVKSVIADNVEAAFCVKIQSNGITAAFYRAVIHG